MLVQGLLLLIPFIQLGHGLTITELPDETDLDLMTLPPNHLMIYYFSVHDTTNHLPDCHGMLVNENHALTGATCITKYDSVVLNQGWQVLPKNQYFYAFTVIRVYFKISYITSIFTVDAAVISSETAGPIKKCY